MLRFLKIAIVLIITSQFVFGQKEVNSPYARFGPGLLEPQGSFKSLGMGSVGTAMRDPVNIFHQNPASFSSIDTNSFVFDFALDYRIIGLNNETESYTSDDMNLHHIMIGFPIGKRMGFVTGVTPFSTGYYNMINTIEPGDPGYDPLIGELQESHKGEGGISRFFFGLGGKVFGGLSLGFNMNFLFGEIYRENKLGFLEDNNYFNNVHQEDISIKGFNFDLGVQYQLMLGNDYYTTLGFNYSNASDFNAESMELLSRGTSYMGSVYSIDTLHYSPLTVNKVNLPSEMSFGIAFGKKDKYTIAADYTIWDWTKATFLGYETNFAKNTSLNFGISYIPNKFANYNALNRVEYRLGGRISDSHLMVNGEQLKEFGITFGAGIPLRRSKSNINVFFEYGSRQGSFEMGLHNENTYSMGLSFNFYDYWFMKRKYD